MDNKIPAWYEFLIQKISKNLNECDLILLNKIVNKVVPTKDQIKYLGKKMTSWLTTIEKMKFWKMLLHLSINK